MKKNLIRFYRKEKRVRLADLSAAIGYSPAMISKWESSKALIRHDQLIKISRALNIPPHKLVKGLFQMEVV